MSGRRFIETLGLIVGGYVLCITIALTICPAMADGVITTGSIQTTNGPVAVIQVYETNGVYEVQFNPNSISNGWQTIYSTTNLQQAISVLRRGLATITNTVQNSN